METLYFESREVVFETGNLSDCAYLVEEGKFVKFQAFDDSATLNSDANT